jgi:voltage-gated potassium channel
MHLWHGFWAVIHRAFHVRGPLKQQTDRAIYALIAVSVGLLVFELSEAPHSPVIDAVIEPIDTFILWFFGFELVLRVASFRPPAVAFHGRRGLGRLVLEVTGRVRYLLRPLVLVDLITVLALVPGLRGLRAVRLLRLLRGARLFRYSDPFEGLRRAFDENRLLFAFGFTLVGTAVVLGGVTLFLLERGVNPNLDSLGDGIWWGLVTLSTVGFGDISPMTPLGRIVGGLLMISGMVTLGLFAGIVAQTLPQAVIGVREEQIRMSGFLGHLVVCGYEPGARMFLDALLEERSDEDKAVVLFGPGNRPDDVPAEFLWVSGDPTKESELDKVRLAHASTVVLIGLRSLSPQQADATTILTAFTIRSYLQKHRDLDRAAPLYMVAEVLDSENVAHLTTAGVDETVETTRVGFSLLAHAIEVHGTAALVSELASVADLSIYVGLRRDDLPGRTDFAALARHLKANTGAMLIGVRDPRLAEDAINPPDALVVTPETLLIYIAKKPVLPEP